MQRITRSEENIRRCAKYGIKCITYNFMPVFDWTRTQLDKKAADGSTSLVMYVEKMKDLDPLKDDIHLPGWDSSYTQDETVRDITKNFPYWFCKNYMQYIDNEHNMPFDQHYLVASISPKGE